MKILKNQISLLFIVFLLSCSYASKSHDKHPRLILTNESLEELRKQSTSSKKELFSQVLNLAEYFRSREIPEFNNANNGFREIGDGMASLGLAYKLTGDIKYIESSEKWIKAMLKCNTWEGSQNLGRSAWTMGLTFLYDWLNEELNPVLRAELIERLCEEVEVIIEDASYTRALSNHLLIETSSIGIVGLVLPEGHPKKQKFLIQADAWAQYIIKYAPIDGSWGEGVQYWQYGTGYFLRFLEAAQTACFKNYFEDYDWLNLTGYFPIYFSMPENLTKVINFSDCGTDRYLPAYLLYLPAQKYRNAYFQDFGKKIQSDKFHKFSWLDFLFYDEKLEAQDFTTLPTFKHFDDHGFISMRSGWIEGETVVGFRCGPAPGHQNQKNPTRIENGGFGPGHQQPDINSFCIFSQNEWLIIDPGYTRKKETKNHNTILVNGFGQAGAGEKWLDYMAFEERDPAPEIVYVEHNINFDYIIGDAGNIYVDEAGINSFQRHLLFLKPDVVVILDDINLMKKSKIENLFQLNEIAKTEKIGSDYRITKNNVEFWLQPILPKNVSSSIEQRLVQGNDVNGLPDHSEGILKTLKMESQSKSTHFLNVISIVDEGENENPKILFEEDTLTISVNGRKRILKYSLEQKGRNLPLLKLVDSE